MHTLRPFLCAGVLLLSGCSRPPTYVYPIQEVPPRLTERLALEKAELWPPYWKPSWRLNSANRMIWIWDSSAGVDGLLPNFASAVVHKPIRRSILPDPGPKIGHGLGRPPVGEALGHERSGQGRLAAERVLRDHFLWPPWQ